MLSWAWPCVKALISPQMPRYLRNKCVQRCFCFGMAGPALQSCLCVPHTLTHLCLPVLSELHWGSLLSSSSTPDNTGLTDFVGLTEPESWISPAKTGCRKGFGGDWSDYEKRCLSEDSEWKCPSKMKTPEKTKKTGEIHPLNDAPDCLGGSLLGQVPWINGITSHPWKLV